MKRILYLGMFDRPYRTENYVAQALRTHGQQVIRLPLNMVEWDIVIDELNKDIDIVLFSKPQRAFFPELLEECKRRGIMTVCWQWDLFYGYRPGVPAQFKSDFLFTTDGGHKEEFAKYNHHVLRQGIHEPEAILFQREYKHDIAFLGSCVTPTRRQFVRFLKVHYGSRFIHHEHTRGMDLNYALAEAKVIVGQNTVESENYWSNRIYEVTGRGGFMLHGRVPGMEAEFTEGQHYAAYEVGNDQDLQAKIEYWLRHDEERERVRQAGHEHTKAHYTYNHRTLELLETIGALEADAPEDGHTSSEDER